MTEQTEQGQFNSQCEKGRSPEATKRRADKRDGRPVPAPAPAPATPAAPPADFDPNWVNEKCDGSIETGDGSIPNTLRQAVETYVRFRSRDAGTPGAERETDEQRAERLSLLATDNADGATQLGWFRDEETYNTIAANIKTQILEAQRLAREDERQRIRDRITTDQATSAADYSEAEDYAKRMTERANVQLPRL